MDEICADFLDWLAKVLGIGFILGVLLLIGLILENVSHR